MYGRNEAKNLIRKIKIIALKSIFEEKLISENLSTLEPP